MKIAALLGPAFSIARLLSPARAAARPCGRALRRIMLILVLAHGPGSLLLSADGEAFCGVWVGAHALHSAVVGVSWDELTIGRQGRGAASRPWSGCGQG